MDNQFFSKKEIEYIKSQPIIRIATASKSADETSQPDVVPVGFDFDGKYFYIGGMNILKSTKYKNILKNSKVALVLDDLKTITPWDLRGIKIYGTADTIDRDDGYMSKTDHPNSHYIRITPIKKWSWGIDEPVFVEGKFNVKKVSVPK